MFKDRKEIKEVETVIGPSVKVKGNFKGTGNIIVDGQLDGSLKTTNVLFVGEQAKINANIEAKEAKISGEVNGNLKIEGYLEVGQSAKITGDIECGNLLVERGAILNGKCAMLGDKKELSKSQDK